MEIFLSCSGEMSKEIADKLEEFLKNVVVDAKPFFFENDIDKGEQWQDHIIKRFNTCDFAIICLTAENINSRWINFEAGALFKKLHNKVAVINFGIEEEIREPLSMFQRTSFQKKDFYRLIKTINKNITNPQDEKKLKIIFNHYWEEFHGAVKELIEDFSKNKLRSNESNVIDEIKKLFEKQNMLLDHRLKNIRFGKDEKNIYETENDIQYALNKTVFLISDYKDNNYTSDLCKMFNKEGYQVVQNLIVINKTNDEKYINYIKEKIIKPSIDLAQIIVVLIGTNTCNNDLTNWEIRYAGKCGNKRIVGIYLNGNTDLSIPSELQNYGDSCVNWNYKKILDTIKGENIWVNSNGVFIKNEK